MLRDCKVFKKKEIFLSNQTKFERLLKTIKNICTFQKQKRN
jgi:hypothetical protein